MTRTITLSAIVALLLGSVAFGQIGNIGPQVQAWDMGLVSNVNLFGGQGYASNYQTVGAQGSQTASTSEGTHAFQGFRGRLSQSASASNVGAAISIGQTGGINGDNLNGIPLGQTQSFSAYGGPAGQYQGVEVVGGQTLTKQANGTGQAQAENAVGMGMIQCGGSTCTDLGQRSLIRGNQNSTLEGSTCASSGVVNTAFHAVVVQQQVANCGLVICP